MPARSRIVLDCRWLGIGGPGRTTELLLRGLAENPPGGQWILWGAEAATTALAWPGADIVPISADPRLLFGQHHAFDIPHGDLVVFMHQARPLRRLPSITVIYDTIALRYGRSWPLRELQRLFLHRVASSSRQIVTISEHSKSSIVRDLRIREDLIEILTIPFDTAFVGRVQKLRRSLMKDDMALFVGGFRPHKNLPRLLRAFETTRFRRDGGRLMLTGGTAEQARVLLSTTTSAQREFITVREVCGQAELDRLFATSLFLVQPSLEEGFGLPAWEALCCGLPVCVSDGGALPEVVRGFAEPFAATSTPGMAAAIDDCASRARASTDADALRSSEIVLQSAPSVSEFGDRFRSVVERYAFSTRSQ